MRGGRKSVFKSDLFTSLLDLVFFEKKIEFFEKWSPKNSKNSKKNYLINLAAIWLIPTKKFEHF
jgi:hypothetical protein